MNQSAKRKAAYPELYGTSACPGSGLARSTSRGRGGTILRGRVGLEIITKKLERRDAAMFKQGRDMLRDRFVRSAKDERFSKMRYMRPGYVRQGRDLFQEAPSP